eukprot:TRINITY_DN69843_c0_g1_i1.p1 TRINITY_DN69843_c0_g1~~TRINITY_DN69843_c0_g1_i1.p1  ORF type:complete len:560 (-),score=82.47 TRINITY_DN69843_c0_g1_i1:46-1695(-)
MATGMKHVSADVRVVARPGDAKLQESDLMETRLPEGQGSHLLDDATRHIRLVSLGQSCGPKMAFKYLGRGAETLPFDWVRTRLDGIFHFFREDFVGFFRYAKAQSVPGIPGMVTYRDLLHSFWHDDPKDDGMLERYGRRIERFRNINATAVPVLFVRVGVSKVEVLRAGELLSELQTRFGPQAHLLFVLNHQDAAKGAAVIDSFDNLLVYFLERGAHSAAADTKGMSAYAEPVRCTLDWILGRPTPAMRFPSLEYVHQVADEILNGLEGLGGLPAFEPHEEDVVVAEAAAANVFAAQSSAVVAATSSVICVPLGHADGLLACVRGIGGERVEKAMPFDTASVKLDGILHCLRTDFEGFVDVSSMERVPPGGCRQHEAFRGSRHAFWRDNLADPAVVVDYKQRFERFRGLAGRSECVLFTRVALESAELQLAGELLSELTQRFGDHACLLLIFKGPAPVLGAAVVGTHENLMLHFTDCSSDVVSAARAYCVAVTIAFTWILGEPLSAMSFESVEDAAAVLNADDSRLVGPCGQPVFAEKDAPVAAKITTS